jgi:hypothetical protein
MLLIIIYRKKFNSKEWEENFCKNCKINKKLYNKI